MVARSNQASLKGRSSARPIFSPTPGGALVRATSIISGSGSTPQTLQP